MEFNAVLMRSAMESANMFKQARVMFVPMPVMDQGDLIDLLRQSGKRLEKLTEEIDMQEGDS